VRTHRLKPKPFKTCRKSATASKPTL
jgi:hypothetical protein